MTMTNQSRNYSFAKLGFSEFNDFVTSKREVLVDKSLFIKDIIEGPGVSLITRPRRFGKTLNMRMLQYFFGIPVDKDGNIDDQEIAKRRAIFSKLKIGKLHPEIVAEYCCKYPVIYMSLKSTKSTSYEGIEDALKTLVVRAYKSHEYLLKSGDVSETDKAALSKILTGDFSSAELQNSLYSLSNTLFNHFGHKVIILVDEYDSPLNDWYGKQLSNNKINYPESQERLQDILNLFSGFLGESFKDNPFLHKGVITGILRIAKANLFSGVNNLIEASILNADYAEHFGFTEEEVLELMHYCELDNDKTSVEEVRSWYNGYNIGEVTIYNPWSIMNYLRTRAFKAYWLKTGSTGLIENAFMLDAFQEEVQKLIEGEAIPMIADTGMVFADIASSPNAFYNLLLFAGYLTPTSIKFGEDDQYMCSVRVPNREVSGIFKSFSKKWLSKKFKIDEKEYRAFITDLSSGNVELFVEKLRQYLAVSSSYYLSSKKNAEVFYNGLFLGLTFSLSTEYFVESERESGFGRADLMIIPKPDSELKIAFVIEFKFGKDISDLKKLAKLALDQINTKNYTAKISQHSHVERIIKLGLAFAGKEVEALWE